MDRIRLLLLLLIVSFLSFDKITGTQISSCRLKMAMSRMSIFKKGDKLIYNEGIIHPDFEENSYAHHIAEDDNEIEYYYIFEDKLPSHNHDKIQCAIKSLDTGILDVSSTVLQESSTYSESYELNEIEVKYQCKPGMSGKAKISMTVNSDNCDPFTVYWYKSCSIPGVTPPINVGITFKSNEIMQDGKLTNVINASNTHDKFLIPQSHQEFTLFLSSTNNSLTLKEPQAIFNQDDLFISFHGTLAKGGEITSSPQILTMEFKCIPLRKSTSDVQIKLLFSDNHHVNLFFGKHCDMVEEIEEYFTLLYIIYWIFVLLIIAFLVVVFLYYLQRNDMTLFVFYEKLKDCLVESYYKLKEKFRQRQNHRPREQEMKRQIPVSGRTNETTLMDEEDENVDISYKLTSSNQSIAKKSEKISSEYGAI